ncbi:MAG TPA: cation:proton antiporter [Campylobacterales bacterium]|nr:cation:proton antiporter [Campylobacterales bacterium]
MDSNVALILIIASILVITPHLSRLLQLPTAPIEIVLGSLLAPLGFIVIGEDQGNVYFDLMAQVGFLYLMFLAGLEVNVKEILNASRDYFIAAILFITVMVLLAIFMGYVLFGFDTIVTAALPLISIGLLATLSKEYGKSQEWVKMAFYIGAIAEVLSITAITVMEVWVAVGLGHELLLRMLYLVAYLAAVVGGYYLLRIVFWWNPEFKTKLMPTGDGKDQDFRLAIGIFFGMVVVMKLLHLELAFGAFIAGLFISTFFHHKRELEHKMSSFGFGFLVPIFFIHVGASFDYGYFLLAIGTALEIFVVMMVARLLASLILHRLIGVRHSVLTALSLSMPLTLLVAAATIGFDKGILKEIPYYGIILASLLEVILSMIAIKVIARRR